jgi:hypothetical protein
MRPGEQNAPQTTRRSFIKSWVSAGVALGLLPGRRLSAQQRVASPEMKIKEYRALGRTGFMVSDIGFGAGYLSNPGVLEAALDMGMNYIDTAEHYIRGNSD